MKKQNRSEKLETDMNPQPELNGSRVALVGKSPEELPESDAASQKAQSLSCLGDVVNRERLRRRDLNTDLLLRAYRQLLEKHL